MGWTGYEDRDDVTERQKAPRLTRNEQTIEAIRHHRHGNEDWFLCEIRKHGMVVERFIALTIWDGGFHKEMDASMHPYYYNCPVEWLDEVPEENVEWRAQVRRVGVSDGSRQHSLFSVGALSAGKVSLPRALLALVVLAFTVAAHAQDAPAKPHPFFDRTNLAGFSADGLTRILDAQSTRMRLTDPCKCYREDVLPAWIVQSTPRMYAYSVAVPVAIMGASYLLHRRGHHKIERMLPRLDIVFDGKSVGKNYSLTPYVAPPVPPVLPFRSVR